ncbi:MAG: protease pro-enzyme activation domain-containing protein, partial [Terracidiphilus sp.]
MKVKMLLVILGSVFSVPVLAQTQGTQSVPSAQISLITVPVDNQVRVRIPKSIHPKAKPQYDAGPLDGETTLGRMLLVLGTTSDRENQARTFVDSQQTKGSPDYHHWLTPEEFGSQFGPSQQDIQIVTAWLQQQGFSITSVAKSGRWIEFSGTSAEVETAFQTQMRHYQVDGELHTANATDISIPAALAPAVRGIVSLHDFYSKPALIPANKTATVKLAAGKPLMASGDGFIALSPPDFATIYDLNPLYKGTAPSPKTTPIDGTGQTIAIVAEDSINSMATTGIDDVANFRQIFGLPSNPPNIILTGPGIDLQAVDTEATLDVEWSGAVAPNATIDLVVSAGTTTTDPVDLSAIYIVDNNLAPIMNFSFSECEQDFGTAGNAFWSALFEQAAAQGISVFVASGDWGAAGCEPDSFSGNTELAVNGLSSTPFNTSVGGTEFDETVNGGTNATFWNSGTDLATGYIPEMVWNDCPAKCDYAGGGGISTVYPVPSWQTLPILGLTGAKFPNRVLPDLSLAAAEGHDPYVFCFSPRLSEPDCQVSGGVVSFNNFAGGTSFASPAMAGVMALINQATGERQGLANYELYALAATESASYPACNSSSQTNPATRPGAQCVFNDVTTGDNGVPGNDTLTFVPPGDVAKQLGYNAVPGFDPASGLGSIDAAKLVSAWTIAAAAFNGSSTTLSASFNGTPLSSSPVSIVHGQPVSVTVSVAALSDEKTQTPTKEVSLLAEGGNLSSAVGVEIASISGSGGTASTGALSVKNLPAGTDYNLYAYFPGDGVFAGSTSNSVALSVAAENTTTSLKSGILNGGIGGTLTPGTTLDYGDPSNELAFTANVAGVSELLPTTGTVTFTDNGNLLGTVSLGPEPGGIAQYIDCYTARNCLMIGQHDVTATFGGDNSVPANYLGSVSSSVTVTVTKGNPDLVSVRAPATAIAGQQVNLNT